MKKLIINYADVAVTDGYFDNSPMDGAIIAEVELEDSKRNKTFISLCEYLDNSAIYVTPVSTLEDQVKEYKSYKEAEKFFSVLDEYELIRGTYDYVVDNIDEQYLNIFNYLSYIVSASWEDTDEYINSTIGKDINNIEIPDVCLDEED